jgi:hypothetical protein
MPKRAGVKKQMTLPKAYEPEQGYKYQILVKYPQSREWEHCDYAKNKEERKYLIGEYNLAYRGTGATFKTIMLPQKYWINSNAN